MVTPAAMCSRMGATRYSIVTDCNYGSSCWVHYWTRTATWLWSNQKKTHKLTELYCNTSNIYSTDACWVRHFCVEPWFLCGTGHFCVEPGFFCWTSVMIHQRSPFNIFRYISEWKGGQMFLCILNVWCYCLNVYIYIYMYFSIHFMPV